MTESEDYKILEHIAKIEASIKRHQSPWLTTSEAASYLRCSVSQIGRLTKSGQLPFSRQNPDSLRVPRLYHRRHLDAYLVTGKNLQSQRLTPEEKRLVKELIL